MQTSDLIETLAFKNKVTSLGAKLSLTHICSKETGTELWN